MRKQIHPAVVAVAIAVVVGIVAIFFIREMGPTGGPGFGEVGNAGPFSPGGSMAKGGGSKAGVVPPSQAPQNRENTPPTAAPKR